MPVPLAGRLTVNVADPDALALAGGTSLLPDRVAVRVQPVVDVNGPTVIGSAVPVAAGIAIVAAIVAAVVAALAGVVLVVAAIVAAVVLLTVAAMVGATTLAEAAIVAAPPVVAETGVAGGGHGG